MPKVTIVDIAKRAGVGVGTASRALNNAPDVSLATRNKVLAAAEELNYHPSAVARRLQGRRSDVIAFMPEVGDQPAGDMQFKDFISVLARSCARHGLDLLIHPLQSNDDYRSSFAQLVRGNRADGLILADIRVNDERIAYLAEQNLPFVAFGRSELPLDYAYVDLDSQAGVQMSTGHLIEQGHQRIAYLGLSLTYTFAKHRFDGYRQALGSHGITFDPELVMNNLATETDTRAFVRRLMRMPGPPSAIVAASDLLAIYAMHALDEVGFQPGRDIAIVGFDDLLLAAHNRPTLTTVRQPFDLMSDLLITTLRGVIEDDPNVQRQALVQPSLIVRDSSKR